MAWPPTVHQDVQDEVQSHRDELPTKADLVSGAVPDAQLPSRLADTAMRVEFVPFWEPAETVAAGVARMDPTGLTITRNTAGTTRPSYDVTEQALWTVKAPVTSVAGRTGAVVLASADVTDWVAAFGAALSTQLLSGTNVTLTYDAGADTVTIDASAPAVDWGTVPAGSGGLLIKPPGGSWPLARPTARADVSFGWLGIDPPPPIVESGTGGLLDNVDYMLVVAS